VIANIKTADFLQNALTIITYIAFLKEKSLYINLVINVFKINVCEDFNFNETLINHIN